MRVNKANGTPHKWQPAVIADGVVSPGTISEISDSDTDGKFADVNHTHTSLTANLDAAGFDITGVGELVVDTDAALGHQAVTIKQDDEDQAFIDFQGTTDTNTSKNITSDIGQNGAASYPTGADDFGPGWQCAGLVKVEINGAERWIPFYEIQAQT